MQAELQIEKRSDTRNLRFLRRLGITKGIREVAGNIGWLSLDRLFRLGGGFIVGTAIARYLGPSNFGVLNYAVAIYGFFNVLSALGLDLLVVRDVSMLPETEDEILGTSFLLKILASVVTTGAAILFTRLARPSDTITIEIVALLSFAAISQGFDVVDFFLQAKTRSRLSVVSKAAVFLAVTAARLLAVFAKLPLLAFAWISALEILFSELSLGFAYFRYHGRIRAWKFNRQRALALLRESWPLMCASLLVLVYMRCDQILLGTLSTPEAVGIYSVAVKLAEVWYAVPMTICASVMPRLLRHRDSKPTLYRQRLQRLYDSMAAASILLAIFVSLTSRYIILLTYGHKYLQASAVLSVHIWTGAFVFLGVVGGNQMIHDKLTIVQLQRSAVGAVANIGLNLLLIPRFGAVGSAAATLTAYGIVAYIMDLIDPRTRHIFRMKTRAYLQLWLFDSSVWHRKEAQA